MARGNDGGFYIAEGHRGHQIWLRFTLPLYAEHYEAPYTLPHHLRNDILRIVRRFLAEIFSDSIHLSSSSYFRGVKNHGFIHFDMLDGLRSVK